MSTVQEYLAALPEDRRTAISAVRNVILQNLPEGFEEGIQWGMIAYYVPHSIYPAGYHCNPKLPLGFAMLANQKNYMALHLMPVYGDSEAAAWFKQAYLATGKKLDMGKACVRFKKLDDLPLDVIGQAIARVPVAEYIGRHEKIVSEMKARRKR